MSYLWSPPSPGRLTVRETSPLYLVDVGPVRLYAGDDLDRAWAVFMTRPSEPRHEPRHEPRRRRR